MCPLQLSEKEKQIVDKNSHSHVNFLSLSCPVFGFIWQRIQINDINTAFIHDERKQAKR